MNTVSPPRDRPSVSAARLRLRTVRILFLAVRILAGYTGYWLFSRLRSADRRTADKNRLHLESALRIKETALSLTGLLIKVGQFMSARVDLLPTAYTTTLSQLQDQVPPAPFETIHARIVEELGAPAASVFDSFDATPIAAASLGQVHQAVLRDAEKTRVAVKVQYPDIERIVACDLAALRPIVWTLQRLFSHIRFDLLYDEFSRIVQQEINYISEGHRAERFRKNFVADSRIISPLVIWPHTTRRVLTMTYVDGIKISAVDDLKAAGIDPRAVATLLAECYMTQILKHLFFHGDPHPGNLSVRPGPTLVFVDFGLMQEIRPETYRGVRKMILSVIDRDTPGIARALVDLGFISRTGRIEAVEGVVAFFMDLYRDVHPTSFQKMTIGQVAKDLKMLFNVAPALQIPNHFMLVGRTAGMLNGLCTRLDPTLNIIELATPHAKKMARGDAPSLWSKATGLVTTMATLPETLSAVLDIMSAGRLRTEMSSEDVTGVLTKIYRLIFLAMVLAIFGIALAGWWIWRGGMR